MIIIFFMFFTSYLLISQNKILKCRSTVIGLNESFEKNRYILPKYGNKNLEINGNVDTSKFGKYYVTYQYRHKKQRLKVMVEDLKEPEFKVEKQTIVLGDSINKNNLVSEVLDDSKTFVYLKQKYKFKKAGNYVVDVCVKDENDNRKCKETNVIVQNIDKTAPIIEGLETMNINSGQNPDFNLGISIKDDIDENPQYSLDLSGFNNNVAGIYHIIYNAVDFQGNKSSYKREVVVKDTNEQLKVIYLTFDDGPSVNTPKVLEILEKYNVPASFFVTGENPEYYPYIKIAHEKGHTIGMHTYSHNYKYIYNSLEHYQKDLAKIAEVIEEQIGFVPKYIRFPGGTSNTVSQEYAKGIMREVVDYVNDNGYTYIDWNSVNGDGEGRRSVSQLIEKAIKSGKGKNKIVMLMHDGGGCVNTVKALGAVIEHYQKLGYEFKAIDKTTPEIHHDLAN